MFEHLAADPSANRSKGYGVRQPWISRATFFLIQTEKKIPIEVQTCCLWPFSWVPLLMGMLYMAMDRVSLEIQSCWH